MYWKARPEYSLYSYVCTESHVQNSCKQAPFRLFTFHLHHLSLRRCVCLSWPVRFLSSLPSLLSTVSINHQQLPGLRLILTIWRFYYWKIDQKSAKNIVLRQYFLSVISLPLWVIFLWQYVFFWQIHRTQFLLLSPVWPRFVLFSRDIFKTL